MAITTALPGGDFQNHYIWVGTDGERFFVNTEGQRTRGGIPLRLASTRVTAAHASALGYA